MAAINHTNVTLIEEKDTGENIGWAHTNRYRSSCRCTVAPLRFSNINSGTLPKTGQTNNRGWKDTFCYVWHKKIQDNENSDFQCLICLAQETEYSRIPTESSNPINTHHLLKHVCLRVNAGSINRWLYFKLVPCDVSEEESETSIPVWFDRGKTLFHIHFTVKLFILQLSFLGKAAMLLSMKVALRLYL